MPIYINIYTSGGDEVHRGSVVLLSNKHMNPNFTFNVSAINTSRDKRSCIIYEEVVETSEPMVNVMRGEITFHRDDDVDLGVGFCQDGCKRSSFPLGGCRAGPIGTSLLK